MDDEFAAANCKHAFNKLLQEFIAVLVINSDSGLHRDRNICFLKHRPITRCNRIGSGHQTCAELTTLDLVAWATHIDVDLVVAVIARLRRGTGHPAGLAAAEL